jgi:site-specific recombinase XerD
VSRHKHKFVRTVHPERITSPLVTTEIVTLVNSWRRDLRARNLAPKTIKTYGESADQLVAHLAAEGVTTAADVSRDHVSDFITHLLATRSASTASVRFRALQQFFAWLVDEEEIAVSPMAKLRPPKIPEQLTPVLDDAGIRALLKVCLGKDFRAVRDTAIVRLFLDTGMRLDELARLRLDDVDLDYDNTATVLGKGRRPRVCPFGAKTAQALDRYLRQRARQKRAAAPQLWLGYNGRGAMTDNGIAPVIRKRGAEAGLKGLHPHMFRHTFAHEWRRAGGDDDSLMRLVGWRSRQMLHRYGASAADARAREAHQRLMPGDRF